MTYKQATDWLKRAEKAGYVAYHQGVVKMDGDYGINIDGDGHNGRLFGCPEIIWSQENAVEFFDYQWQAYK